MSEAPRPAPTLGELASCFLQIALSSFGGGLSAWTRRLVVEQRQWLNDERVSEAVARTGGRRRHKALLVVSGRRLLVPPRGAVIGRSRDCDIVLDDAGVSRRHAELRPEAERWTIEDLGSTNGVRVNGFIVDGAHELRSGDRIGMGSTEMLFEGAP